MALAIRWSCFNLCFILNFLKIAHKPFPEPHKFPSPPKPKSPNPTSLLPVEELGSRRVLIVEGVAAEKKHGERETPISSYFNGGPHLVNL